MVLKCGPNDINLTTMMTIVDGLMELDPFILFTSAIRSDQSKRKFQGRLKFFLILLHYQNKFE
jgi:hypothetical protein